MDSTLPLPRRIPGTLLWATITMLFTVLGFATMAISAQYQLPLWPVAITLQTAAVGALAFGAASTVVPAASTLRTRFGIVLLSLSAVGPYAVAAASIGKPLSASNPLYSGGYLYGFMLMAALISFGWTFRQEGRSNFKLALGLMLAASVIVHIPGIPVMHYALVANVAPDQTWLSTLYSYAWMYIPGDLIKAFAVASIAAGLTAWQSKRHKR
jgi:biotin transport system substrate-specific component